MGNRGRWLVLNGEGIVIVMEYLRSNVQKEILLTTQPIERERMSAYGICNRTQISTDSQIYFVPQSNNIGK